MTTLAAWVGVDQRAAASLYLVSDSRFMLFHKHSVPTVHTNEGRKIFACKNEPHLFGYWGQVAFPSAAISDAVSEIDAGALFGAADDATTRQAIFEEFVTARLRHKLKVQTAPSDAYEFAILHGARQGSGMQSAFRLWILGWKPESGWNVRERELEPASEVLYAGGSGAESFLQRNGSWKDSDLGRTSRGVFSAFVEALRSKYDPYSGGAPQLGGLFRKGRAMEFGVIYKDETFLRGKPVNPSNLPVDLEWFNELFERADPSTLQRLPDAQRHAKPNWLRPYQAPQSNR